MKQGIDMSISLALPKIVDESAKVLHSITLKLQVEPPPIVELNALLDKTKLCQTTLSDESKNWVLRNEQRKAIEDFALITDTLQKKFTGGEVIVAKDTVMEILPIWERLQKLGKELYKFPPVRKVEKKKSIQNLDWKAALTKLSDQMSGKDEEIKEEKEKEKEMAQAVTMEELKDTKARLLKSTEDDGLIEAGIILARSYLPSVIWDKLVDNGWKLDFLFNRYVLIKNARLFGVHGKFFDKNKSISTYNHKLSEHNKKNATYHWAGVGPIHRKGDHFYGLVFPKRTIEGKDDFIIQEWEFSTETKE